MRIKVNHKSFQIYKLSKKGDTHFAIDKFEEAEDFYSTAIDMDDWTAGTGFVVA